MTPEAIIDILASNPPLSTKQVCAILNTKQFGKVRGLLTDLVCNEVAKRVQDGHYKLIELSHKNPIAGDVRKALLPTELAAQANRKNRVVKANQRKIHPRRDSGFLAPDWKRP